MFELDNPTQIILSEIQVLKLNQSAVAKTCAIAIMMVGTDNVDWKAVNAAIVKRWSLSARERVLTMAWKIVGITLAEYAGRP